MTDWVKQEIKRPYHQVSQLFPLMQGKEFEQLKADIDANGLLEAIWIHPDGSIIDGRNRHRACIQTGAEPRFRKWDSNNGSLVMFVVSANLHRRHLTYDQRVGIALKLEPAFAEEAKQRMLAGNPAAKSQQGRAAKKAAEQAKVGARTVYEMKAVQQEEPKIADKLIAGKTTVRKERKKQRRKKRVEKAQGASRNNSELDTSKRYPVIYADPPWRYEHVKTDNRRIENQYPTMSLKEILALPVKQLATEDAVLFLWATSPKLEEAMQVIKAWGFAYRTCMVWDKGKIGMGYYARQQHELLLIATCGQLPVPEPENRPPSVVREPRGKHSKKPEVFYEIIERMYPEYDKKELFAREERLGWEAWGNQL